jgi:signal transduction histidine kinase
MDQWRSCRDGGRLRFTVSKSGRAVAKWRSQFFFRRHTSVEYEVWKRQFLGRRLHLCLWVASLCHLSFAAIDLDKLVFRPRSEDVRKTLEVLGDSANYEMLKQSILLGDGGVILLLLVGLGVWRLGWGRQHPRVLFVLMSWSMTLVPEVIGSVVGVPLPPNWEFIFMAQVVLLPVYWQLHLLGQGVPLLYYFGVNSILGLAEIPTFASFLGLEAVFYTTWICLICNIAVWLYDRLQYQEFESRRELKLFLHAVTHDLRIPVVGTAIVLKKLLQKADVTSRQVMITTSKLEQLLAGSDRQLSLINSILAAYQAEHSAFRLSCQRVQVSVLVEAVLVDLAEILEENQVVLSNRIAGQLFVVQADADQLWRVFTNLITNAAVHNPKGVHVILDITLQKTGFLCCTVEDNGVGISLPQQRRLFELYYRGEQSRYAPGLGLGLYLCRKIVLTHGGEMGVVSELGRGSSFWLTLPIEVGC